MIIKRFFLTLLLVASVACSESPLTPTSPESISNSLTLTSESLNGNWSLSSIQPSGQARQATPAGAIFTLTFNDGRLSTRTDVNTCTGAFAVSGQTLTAGPALACTRAAGPNMAFENAYTGLLSGEHSVTASGNALVLSSSRGVLRFTRQ